MNSDSRRPSITNTVDHIGQETDLSSHMEQLSNHNQDWWLTYIDNLITKAVISYNCNKSNLGSNRRTSNSRSHRSQLAVKSIRSKSQSYWLCLSVNLHYHYLRSWIMFTGTKLYWNKMQLMVYHTETFITRALYSYCYY